MRHLTLLILSVFLAVMIATPATAQTSSSQPKTMDEVIDRVVANESHLVTQIRKYSPIVETYIQTLKPDRELGYIPVGDKYFLGRADFSNGVSVVSISDTSSKPKKALSSIGGMFSFGFEFLPEGFVQMAFIDTEGFDKDHYAFEYVHREFLGEVRCLVFDVTPKEKNAKGRFLGRIWVEDKDYNLVRFNGGYGGSGHTSYYFHFDSWRMNMQPGVWMPSFIYSDERNLQYALTKKVDFKSQTRFWGYNLAHPSQEQELSKILVDSAVQDDTKTANDLSPVQAQRAWDRQAEDNVIERLQRIGLISPKGEVDKVLETVVNNLEVTNNLEIEPEVRCRVMMTTTLESFTVGHTVVLSRGLIDVLPDEASLAAVLAHELGHVVLGHRLDSTYAFFDQLLVDDKDTYRQFDFARSPTEEEAASTKGAELLAHSPYKTQLGNAARFMAALESRQREIPNLISAHLGNHVPISGELKETPVAEPKPTANASANPQNIAALPIGGRVKLDPWDDKLEMVKNKPVGIMAEREKMPFEVTPFMPYLTRFGDELAKPVTASTSEPKPAEKKPN